MYLVESFLQPENINCFVGLENKKFTGDSASERKTTYQHFTSDYEQKTISGILNCKKNCMTFIGIKAQKTCFYY